MPAKRNGPHPVPNQPPVSNDAGRKPAAVVQIDSGDHRERLRARRDELVEQYAGMVRPIAERVMRSLPPSFEIDDLIQTGMIGLMTAATRYRPDEHGGTPFSAYARFHIRGTMLDSVSGRSWKNATMLEMQDPGDSKATENGRSLQPGKRPRRDKLREILTTEPDLDEAIDARRRLRQAEDAIAYLDVRSRRVLDGYFREEKTLEAVGETVGLSRQTAGEIRDAAIKKVKRILHVVEK